MEALDSPSLSLIRIFKVLSTSILKGCPPHPDPSLTLPFRTLALNYFYTSDDGFGQGTNLSPLLVLSVTAQTLVRQQRGI